MLSIRKQLLLGLLTAGLLSATALCIFVFAQYGLSGASLDDIRIALPEIIDHVIIPISVFVLLFGFGAYIVIHKIETLLLSAASRALRVADTGEGYKSDLEKFPRELRPFIEAINHLTSNLTEHAKRQEAFAADAAHELKTPLAILALELDNIPHKYTGELREQLHSLSSMIDQLLLLAWSNTADLHKKSLSICPASLARTLVTDMAPSIIKSGRTFSLEVSEPVATFVGLQEAVSSSLRTLIDNAVRATPIGGDICLTAGPGPSFSLIDGGTGLSESDLESFKARGVRADSAPGGSAGLGLAIADRIIAAHGGDLTTLMPESTGLRINFKTA